MSEFAKIVKNKGYEDDQGGSGDGEERSKEVRFVVVVCGGGVLEEST